ncbi:MAG TPA: LytR C-terminal domain-containing protein [Agrococcus sp.]|nr:LytR C-terminal domain-containing protein [Agrococcus sp.]
MKRTQRVGAHRSTSASGWPRWAILLAALAVTIVLIAVGLFALDMMRPQAPAPSPTTAPETITDPSAIDPSLDASITVLDASGERSFAAGVGQALADEGWTVIATGGSTEPADTTIVWFDAEELAPVARGLVERLGAGEARLSDGRVAGTPITIVLGPDAVGTAPSTEPRDDGEMTHSPTPDAP